MPSPRNPVRFTHEFEDGVNVLSLLAANQAVAFARMSRSIWTCRSCRRSLASSSRSTPLSAPVVAWPPAAPTQLAMVCAVTSNSRASSAGVLPARTSSTICSRNSAGYGGLVLPILNFLLYSVRCPSNRGNFNFKRCVSQWYSRCHSHCHAFVLSATRCQGSAGNADTHGAAWPQRLSTFRFLCRRGPTSDKRAAPCCGQP